MNRGRKTREYLKQFGWLVMVLLAFAIVCTFYLEVKRALRQSWSSCSSDSYRTLDRFWLQCYRRSIDSWKSWRESKSRNKMHYLMIITWIQKNDLERLEHPADLVAEDFCFRLLPRLAVRRCRRLYDHFQPAVEHLRTASGWVPIFAV